MCSLWNRTEIRVGSIGIMESLSPPRVMAKRLPSVINRESYGRKRGQSALSTFRQSSVFPHRNAARELDTDMKSHQEPSPPNDEIPRYRSLLELTQRAPGNTPPPPTHEAPIRQPVDVPGWEVSSGPEATLPSALEMRPLMVDLADPYPTRHLRTQDHHGHHF